MANINTEIQAIETATRGEEVRDSIIGALQKINADVSGNIPAPTISDAGKFLSVDSEGDWTLVTPTSAEGVSF